MPTADLETLSKLAQGLIAIPSVSSNREECNRVLAWVEKELGDPKGLHLHHFEHEGFRSLIISTREGRRSKLILNGHLDVVYGHESQFRPEVRDGFLYGRGSYDMKGAAAVYLQVLKDIKGMPAAKRPDLQVQFVTDEEIGGHHGAERLVEEGFTGDLFVAGEPTELGICHMAKGVYWVTVRIPGNAGHAAMPWKTENPVLTLQHGLSRLLDKYPPPTKEVWKTTATPTGLSAGNSHNRVPDTLELKLDVRYIPQESPDDINAFLQSCWPTATIEVVQRSWALETRREDPMIDKIVGVQADMTGQRPRFYSEHFASDARYWGRHKVPSVCWGPCGGGMHADDERLELKSLMLYYKMVHRLIEVA